MGGLSEERFGRNGRRGETEGMTEKGKKYWQPVSIPASPWTSGIQRRAIAVCLEYRLCLFCVHI